MAATLFIKSDGHFTTLKLLATINSSRQWPHLLAKSCRLVSDGQTSSNLSLTPTAGDTQKSRATLPSLVTSYHSFLITYSMRIAVSPTENHQVFINYRGDQLRHNFVFERHGIKFFVDKDEQRGKDLKHLFVRIEESRIALAIFSTRYPESRWCMDELVKMRKLADKEKLQVIPIFYKVEPREVRKPTRDSEFGKNFWRLAEASDGYQIKKWKEALECISDKMGLSLGDKSSEADFVEEIVKEVLRVIEAIGHEEEENHCGKIKDKGRGLQSPR